MQSLNLFSIKICSEPGSQGQMDFLNIWVLFNWSMIGLISSDAELNYQQNKAYFSSP